MTAGEPALVPWESMGESMQRVPKPTPGLSYLFIFVDPLLISIHSLSDFRGAQTRDSLPPESRQSQVIPVFGYSVRNHVRQEYSGAEGVTAGHCTHH